MLWASVAYYSKGPKSRRTLGTQALSFYLESGFLGLKQAGGRTRLAGERNSQKIGKSTINAPTASEIARLEKTTNTNDITRFESLVSEKCRSRNKRTLIRRILDTPNRRRRVAYTRLIGFSQRRARLWVDSRCALISISTRLRSRYLCFASRPRKLTRFGPNGSPRANDPMLPSRSSAGRSAARRRPTTSGNVNSLLSTKPARFCVFLPPSPSRTRSRSNSPKQAIGVREQPLTTHLICRPLGV